MNPYSSDPRFAQSAANPSAIGMDRGLAAFFRQTYMWMTTALAVTGLVSQSVLSSPELLRTSANPTVSLVLFVLAIGISVYFSRAVHRVSPFVAGSLLFAYAAVLGVMLAPLGLIYTGASINRAFFSAAGTFGVAALYGATTRRSMDQVGDFYRMGIMGALVAMVVNMFLRSEAVDFVTSLVIVIASTAGTAYNNAELKQLYRITGGAGNAAINASLSLYANFLNIFLSLLRLMGERRDD